MALVKSHHQMLPSSSSPSPSSSAPPSGPFPSPPSYPEAASSTTKRKRRPPGTPDPDAEVVALSPRTLLESDRYVCEICGQGFQREQNLQMHRRRHKVPWRLLKRAVDAAGDGAAGAAKKRVFVCPEASCLHHDPAHALGDLVGIKKHFRRKHGGQRQWVCARCAKGYAVQSDYKAHLKTCGTRGHTCDCGRVFSRVESFIEHQDACNSSRSHPETTPVSTLPVIHPSRAIRHPLPLIPELQLLPTSTTTTITSPSSTSGLSSSSQEPHATNLQLSIGPTTNNTSMHNKANTIKEEMGDMTLLIEEKAAADLARQRAREQVEAAERELEYARRARQQARAQLEKALAFREQAARMVAQVTCHACRQLSLAGAGRTFVAAHEGSTVALGSRQSLRGGGG